MPSLLSKEEMDAMNSDNGSDHDLIFTEILENICDGIQSHLKVNRREASYKFVIVLGKDNQDKKES